MRIDTQKLVLIITLCFDFGTDGRLTSDQRKEFGALGKRLRGSLVNLLTADFKEDLQPFIDAEKALETVNGSLNDMQEDIDSAAATVQKINDLIGKLDKLLSFATNFV